MKKIAVINDISSFGRCSLTAALPIISALGTQCVPLVTEVFSAQTGYGSFHRRSLEDEILKTVDSWQGLNESFDAIVTGFISGAKMGEIIAKAAKTLRSDGTILVVDPVMGDDGLLYPCHNDSTIAAVKALAETADVITPNFTELCLLCGQEMPKNPSRNDFVAAAEALSKLFSGKTVITTGLALSKSEIGTAVFSDGKFNVVVSKRIGGSFSGTGDIMTSIVAALMARGTGALRAVEIAAHFISDCIALTVSRLGEVNRNDGVEFEPLLGELCAVGAQCKEI